MPLKRINAEIVDEILKEYPSLKSLNLSHNEIKVFEQLDRITTLEKINLSNNQLTEISCFNGGLQQQQQQCFRRLVELDLSYNQMYVCIMNNGISA